MTSYTTFFKAIIILLLLMMAAWIGFEIYSGNYLQAVAISGVGSVFLWFASGAATQSNDKDDNAP